MRRDVQEIFRSTPHEKQVMMFSATLSKDVRPVCKKFMQDVRILIFTKNLQNFNLFEGSWNRPNLPSPSSNVCSERIRLLL